MVTIDRAEAMKEHDGSGARPHAAGDEKAAAEARNRQADIDRFFAHSRPPPPVQEPAQPEFSEEEADRWVRQIAQLPAGDRPPTEAESHTAGWMLNEILAVIPRADGEYPGRQPIEAAVAAVLAAGPRDAIEAQIVTHRVVYHIQAMEMMRQTRMSDWAYALAYELRAPEVMRHARGPVWASLAPSSRCNEALALLDEYRARRARDQSGSGGGAPEASEGHAPVAAA